MELNELYRDVILDHNRHPRNFGGLDSPDASVEGFNPMCGDRLTLRLRMHDGTISDIRFEGQGCAISTASASLMTEAVKGKTRAEAMKLFERVHRLLTDDAARISDELGKLAALSGVRTLQGSLGSREVDGLVVLCLLAASMTAIAVVTHRQWRVPASRPGAPYPTIRTFASAGCLVVALITAVAFVAAATIRSSASSSRCVPRPCPCRAWLSASRAMR